MRRAEESYRQRLLKRQLVFLVLALASLLIWVTIYLLSVVIIIFSLDGDLNSVFFPYNSVTQKYSITVIMIIFIAIFLAMLALAITVGIEYLRQLHILSKGYKRKTEELRRIRELREMHSNGYSFDALMNFHKDAKAKKKKGVQAHNIHGEEVKSEFFSDKKIKNLAKKAFEEAKKNLL